MTGDDLLRQYGWALGNVLVLLFLLPRAVMRRLGQRTARRDLAEASRNGDRPAVGPLGFANARRQFILTLALLAIIVVVAILTHLQ